MPSGRKPKPSHLKSLEGNLGKRPVNEHEPEPANDVTDPPEWFTAKQCRIWHEVLDEAPDGMIKELDRAVLTTLVVAINNHRDAVQELEGQPLVVETATGQLKQHPLVVMIRSEAATIVRAASELGFSPTSRSRVTLAPGDHGKKSGKKDKQGEKNPFERFAKR